MAGQREALEVLRQALDGEAPAPTEDALVDLEDILQGALEDTRAILGIEILGIEEEGDEGDEA
jgi:hypothetical protein